MIRIIIFTFIILVFHGSVFSEEIRLLPSETLPEIRDIKVQANVFYDSSTNIYTYNYMVINSNISTGAIDRMEIDITKPEGSIRLSEEGLRYGNGYLRFGSERLFEKFGSLVIRVGTSAPSDWITGITVRKTISWGAAKEGSFIYPNSSNEGFELNSRGLPGIRQFTTSPYFKQQPVEEATKEDIDRVRAIEKAIIFYGKTLGPTAPPAPFVPIDFLNYLISLKHESYNLGWIKNAGIEQSLDAKLDNAKKKIEQGNIEAAKNILNAFINEVEAQGCVTYEDCSSGKHLAPEAYALLKHNVQYLISNLR